MLLAAARTYEDKAPIIDGTKDVKLRNQRLTVYFFATDRFKWLFLAL